MSFRRASRAAVVIALAAILVMTLGACEARPQPVPSPSSTPSAGPEPVIDYPGPVAPTGETRILATGLKVPWSMVRLESGSTLISERDTAVVKELTPTGQLRDVGTVPGVAAAGEGGLLGLAVLDEEWLYAYITAADDNRIVRMALNGQPGAYSLGEPEVIASGMRKAKSHNGGRIKFGPDGYLYATVGDARLPDAPQNASALNGKILRMTAGGGVPADNPFADSLVYSMGHRNPQGLAWDASGQLWAAEFGQNTWDEFNRIEAGGNYGWPVVEGIAGTAGYIDPVQQWDTDDASPSGLVFTRGTFVLAALRGQRLWRIYVDPDSVYSVPSFIGVFGRIRDVVEGPNGTLWLLTNNTSNGVARPEDDKLIEVQLTVVPDR